MAQLSYRARLRSPTFPLIAENFGESVILPQFDADDRNLDMPQVYYAHNVLPTSEGIQSIGYNQLVQATSAGETQFEDVFLLRDASENRAWFSHTADGRNFISLYPFYNWINTTAIAGATASTIIVTTAHVGGETYIYFSNVGCYKYDFASNSLVSVTLTGLVAANILGITAAYGYLIAFTVTGVAWSSTIDPTDFTPSDVTGAGGASIQSAHGKIVSCVPSPLGFTVFTTNNAIEANYTGNAAYPFSFPPLPSAGGIAGRQMVAINVASSSPSVVYAYTTNGLQAYGTQSATTFLAEITDFIAGAYFEDFDESTLAFTREQLADTMLKRIAYISDRYLILSYGKTSFTHAIVLDTVLKRLGKLKIDHVSCFEWAVLSPEVVETPKKSIAFLQASGAVQVVDFDVADEYTNGVAILGKYQFIRPRMTHLHTITISNVRVVNNFKCYHFGERTTPEDVAVSECTQIASAGNTRVYGVDKLCKNHSFILKGAFALVNLKLNFNPTNYAHK